MKIYLQQLDSTDGWYDIPLETWQELLTGYVFQVADSFAFYGFLETVDLFPNNLDFFSNWELKEVGLIEVHEHDTIVGRFRLNDSCRERLLEFNFPYPHNLPYPTYTEQDPPHGYQIDLLYFFAGERLVGMYIDHERELKFPNQTESELQLLHALAPEVKARIYDTEWLDEQGIFWP